MGRADLRESFFWTRGSEYAHAYLFFWSRDDHSRFRLVRKALRLRAANISFLHYFVIISHVYSVPRGSASSRSYRWGVLREGPCSGFSFFSLLLFMDNRCLEAVHPRGPAEGEPHHYFQAFVLSLSLRSMNAQCPRSASSWSCRLGMLSLS